MWIMEATININECKDGVISCISNDISFFNLSIDGSNDQNSSMVDI